MRRSLSQTNRRIGHATRDIQAEVDAVSAHRKTLWLDPADLHPKVRIAHLVRGSLRAGPRIIFDHELVLLSAGRAKVKLGRRKLEMLPYQLLLVRPFVPHVIQGVEGESEPVCEHLAIHFDLSPSVPPRCKQVGRRSPYEVRFTRGLRLPTLTQLAPGHRVVTTLLDALKAWNTASPLGETQAAAHVLRAVLDLMEMPRAGEDQAGLDERNRLRLERAITVIDSRFHESLTAEQLAQASSLSMPHFNRLFRQWTGLSPMMFLRRKRIEAARKLLADVDMSVKQVAARVGFDNPYHFSRAFHQIDGLSPTDYRAALLTTPADV
ncbi:MAG: helix-turn-helix transcriptional regulator [Phycisphaeraceae bacterium]|nr:helix-turn-helix transcriptional regulator [Phycisphaeraceae bacterium]